MNMLSTASLVVRYVALTQASNDVEHVSLVQVRHCLLTNGDLPTAAATIFVQSRIGRHVRSITSTAAEK